MKSVWDDSSMIYVKINNDKVYMRPVISKAEARSYLEKLSGIDAEYDTNNKDRLKALNSENCTYDTFSGKADNMNSNVKFIIETDAIETEE